MLWQFVDAKQVKFAKDKDYLATGVDDNRGISKSIRHFIRQFIRHLTTFSQREVTDKVSLTLLKVYLYTLMSSENSAMIHFQISNIDKNVYRVCWWNSVVTHFQISNMQRRISVKCFYAD